MIPLAPETPACPADSTAELIVGSAPPVGTSAHIREVRGVELSYGSIRVDGSGTSWRATSSPWLVTA